MPLLNGIDAAKEIRKALPGARVVFLSMHVDAIYVRKALEAGGLANVLKSGAADDCAYIPSRVAFVARVNFAPKTARLGTAGGFQRYGI